MARPKVFVSHGSTDAQWCAAFVQTLKGAGIDAWYDGNGLYAGVRWVQTIERELESREVFVLIITPRSWASNWVRNELALALTHHKQIIGVIHEDTPNLSGFILIYQLLNVVGQGAAEAAQLVAEALAALGQGANLISVPTDDAVDGQVVVPQGLGADRSVSPPISAPNDPLQGKLVKGAADFATGIDAADPRFQPKLRRLHDWALTLEREGLVRLSTYHGKNGVLTLLPRLLRDDVGLVTIYNTNGAYVQFWRSVFERRAPTRLARVEQIVAPIQVGQGTWTSAINEELLESLTAAYREAAANEAGLR